MSAQIPVHLSCGRWPHESPDRVEFYDASQPRDWAGRWTRGGAPVAVSRAASQAKNGYLDLIGNTARTTDDEFSRVQVDPERARRIAEAYVALPEVDEAAKPAYQTLRKELKKQYRFMLASGVKVVVQDTDPYPSVRELIADVEENKTLRVLSTASTGGHPFFTDAENDIFRAVHDFYGHAATGRDFSRHGEEAAYLAHAEMFSPLARRALTTETRGQNSMLNFGPDKGEFPVQKLALLPEEFSDPASVTIASKPLSSVTSSATTPLEFYVGEIVSAIIELACHSPACAPPPVGTGGSVGRMHPSLSTRKVDGEDVTTLRDSDWDGLPDSEKIAAAKKLVKNVSSFADLDPSDPEAVISRMEEHLELVLGTISESEVRRTEGWYDAAKGFTNDIAAATGLHSDAVAAVTAALSASMAWSDNVYQARLITDMHVRNPEISRDVVDLVGALDFKAKSIPTGMTVDQAKKLISDTVKPGMKFNDIDDSFVKAVVFRAQSTWESPDKQLRTPEVAVSPDGTMIETGKTSKIRFQSYANLAKALNILNTPTAENISIQLGAGVKIRSFYNNIHDPNDPHGDVTIDTHAFSNIIGMPRSGIDPVMKKTQDTATTGGGQTVKLMAIEAFRRVSERHGFEYPRQLQSVLWERWKDAQGNGRAASARREFVRERWDLVADGKLTRQEALKTVESYVRRETPLAGQVGQAELGLEG